MICPKCKEYFEEGSRRFCPTDGARLVTETAGLSGGREGGIFANLIPKIEGIREFDQSSPETPRFTHTGVESNPKQTEPPADKADDEIFFELDDIQSEPADDAGIVIPMEPMFKKPLAAEPGPAVRKVKPHEIPAGHVDLWDATRPAGMGAEFDSDDPSRFIGRTVKGRYRVTEFLGGDESGLAYLADDKIVEDRMVLVRILTKNDQADEIMDSILAEERVSLSHFSHPNVARLIDSGQFTNGTDFLVTEYVDALSVGDILSIHGKFPAQRAARIIRQAAAALNEAHQEGILHRDIRCENLIVDTTSGDTEQTTVVNFGASNGEPTSRNIGYKAHEVLDGRIATVSSDIFSLASVAYEMLTGRLPFSGGSARELTRSQNAGFDGSRADLGRGVNDVFTKAFAYHAGDRYPKARDFGDAFCSALAETEPVIAPVKTAASAPVAIPVIKMETLKPIVPTPAAAPPPVAESKSAETGPPSAPAKRPISNTPAEKRSPAENKRSIFVPILGLLGLAALIVGLWYYFSSRPQQTAVVVPANTAANTSTISTLPLSAPVNTEMPPPRNIVPPANSSFYQNRRENLRGDLVSNFVGFTLYYPKDWKVNGPQQGSTTKARGKFLDISRVTPGGSLREQVLISYYLSSGTYAEDAPKFPELVRETNETLQNLVPGYRMISEREIRFNGDWRAHEIKFQFDGPTGEKAPVWGRRLFVPAGRAGVRNGFEITMLATSAATDVRGVDDVGVRGELASILYTFEPSQNF